MIGEPGAFATSKSAALRVPGPPVKVTLSVQLCVGESDAPKHVPEVLKSVGLMPGTMILPIARGAAPLLVTVIVCAPPLAAKMTLLGLTLRSGIVPDKAAKL
jgi:hypothetical protein